MRIVITGATGFLGSALLHRLAVAGVEVVGVTRKQGTHYHQVSDYSETPAGDVLVHLAEDCDRLRVNAAGSVREQEMQATMGFLMRRGYRKLVYASSSVLYGDRHATPRKTDDAIEVVDSYTRIKSASESMVLASEGIVARISNVYGPDMAKGNVLSKILGQIPGTGSVVVGDSAPVRDFLWIDDAADALARLAMGSTRGIFNIGTGVGSSIGEVASLALAVAGEPGREIISSHPSFRFSSLVLDISETTRCLGWNPATSLKDGVSNMLLKKNKRT